MFYETLGHKWHPLPAPVVVMCELLPHYPRPGQSYLFHQISVNPLPPNIYHFFSAREIVALFYFIFLTHTAFFFLSRTVHCSFCSNVSHCRDDGFLRLHQLTVCLTALYCGSFDQGTLVSDQRWCCPWWYHLGQIKTSWHLNEQDGLQKPAWENGYLFSSLSLFRILLIPTLLFQ